MGWVSEEDICKKLKNKDLSGYPDPMNLTALEQSFWVLAVSKDKTLVKKLTAKAISYILSELKEILLDEKSIIRAFARAGKKIKIHKEGKKIFYELMASGRAQLMGSPLTSTESGVQFFDGKKPWTDPTSRFPRIVELLEGELYIVDPFYGNGTLHVLSLFGEKRKVRFLSSELGGEEQKNIAQFNTNLSKFKKEFGNIEMRSYPKRYELHDRYIIAKNALVVIGHGIKDLGSKESFVIFLPKSLVHGFLPELKSAFETRWNNSTKI